MSITSALTRIKLLELERQRDRLHQTYSAIEAKANQAPSPLERLQALYDGLRATRFAQAPLHPDIANLDALLFQARVGRPEPDLIAGWVTRLEQGTGPGPIARRGRLRLRAIAGRVAGTDADGRLTAGAGQGAVVGLLGR